MKATALVCTQDQRFSLRLVTLPDPGPGEVSIRTLFSGVSVGTEFALVRGKLDWGPFPICTGYMGAGVVETVGAGVDGFREGDVVYYRGSKDMALDDGTTVSAVAGVHCSGAVTAVGGLHGVAKVPEGVDPAVASTFVLPAVALHGADLSGARVGHRPATALPGEIVVDGDLSEWAGRRFVPLGLPCQARTSRGVSDPRAVPSDLFPELSFFAGTEALHVAMRATGAAPGDGLTLFLDPRAPESFCTAGSYVWAGIGLKEDGAVEVSRGETSPPGPGTVGRWRRTPDGMLEAEWSIPWEWAGLDAFPASGRLGLSVIYRQGRPPHARLSWIESYFEWMPLHYGELRLVPDAAAESGDALPWLLRVEP